MAANLLTYPDNSDFEDYSDWIELYNPASTNVSLANYYLTDTLSEPFKWVVPSNAVINAYGYLMIRADGFDAAPGQSFARGYWPWGSTFTARWYHASFKLSTTGEELGLYRTILPPHDNTLIPTNAVWKYLDKGTNPGTSWMTLSYDDTGWPQGPAQLGYGDGDEATVVGYGTNTSKRFPTTHFRHHFNVTDPSRLGSIRFKANIDDGAIFYLNGEEFGRLRMPSGTVTYTNYASATVSIENVLETVELPRALFRAGENVLAVEVHQSTANSTDISFAAELIVAEITGDPILVDSVKFPLQTADVSYGRNSSSSNGWSYFAYPTPEGPNVTEPLVYYNTVDGWYTNYSAPDVTASLASGFYTNTQTVTLSCVASYAAIRYTLDSSFPTITSPIYSAPLTISNNTIVRARAFVSGWIPSPTITRSYFMNEPLDRTLPVISFVFDPATFSNKVTGIYTNSSNYAYKGREMPGRVEFFEADRAQRFAVNAGVKIGGENGYGVPQKTLNIHMSAKYGDEMIKYPFFPGPAATYGGLNVRQGSDNWKKDMLRDALMSLVQTVQTELTVYSYRPCVGFVNGNYYGIYEVRKFFDPLFFANEQHLEPGSYDLVQYAHDGTGTLMLMADTGNTDAYETFHTFYTTHDLKQATNYNTMLAQMNMNSFLDFVVTEDFGCNTSWPHNREFWRAHAPGAKWQWSAPDYDRTFDAPNLKASLIDDFGSSYLLFKALTNNTDFVNLLLQRYAAHLGSTLHSNRLISIVDSVSGAIAGEIPRHVARWAPETGLQSVTVWQTNLTEIRQFSVERPYYAISNLVKNLGRPLTMTNMASVTLAASPSVGGNVRIAGVPMTPQYNSIFNLFTNIPVVMTAEAAPGYVFTSWSNGSTNSTIQLAFTSNQSLIANFQTSGGMLPVTITNDTTLEAGSVFSANGDVTVVPNVTLTIGPGVKVLMPVGGSIYVKGALLVNGTTNAPVQMLAQNGQSWGNLCFLNATGPSVVSNAIFRSASTSLLDPINLPAAVASFNSVVTLDGVDIEANLPFTARYGSTVVRNSHIHILFTGDCINVKYGPALVENNTLIGCTAVDTDGIDFDVVDNGIIRGNRIYAFNSVNGDAIDLGFSQNVQIYSNRVFNVYDKGTSVGQGTTLHAHHNLYVNCGLGMGVKDLGSTVWADHNTYARCTVGVACYVKFAGRGGGTAYITNCIFTRCQDAPVTKDSLSIADVGYSISDTLPLTGIGNLLADPLFTEASTYNFSLTAGSPAINAGDPSYPLDQDGSRTDMGAYYVYDPADYPYLVPNIVVVNEVLAHSHSGLPDWIELHNNSSKDLDIGGWYLSDEADTPMKFRIADGTILPANGYQVFYEDIHFGLGSTNSGALIPFALSENGDTVNIFGPSDGLRPDYIEKEDFGPTATGVTMGRYYKASTHTYNFVSMTTPTPGATNSEPLTGPLVIGEIMYHPPVGEAEYLELVNITTNAVTLLDTNTGVPWIMTKGLTHVFPTSPPLTLAPHERILLVRNSAVFFQNYTPPAGTRVIQWQSGGLDNNGETLEISKPGDVDGLGVRQYIRVDRVDFTDTTPWPTGPDGSGTSLVRINEGAYGNDFSNWTESQPTPGQTSFSQWVTNQNFLAGQSSPDADPDGDGVNNLTEFADGTNPNDPNSVRFGVAVSLTGPGTVTRSLLLPKYDKGTNLTLNAMPYAGCYFVGWTGSTNSTNLGLNVMVVTNWTLTATFAQQAVSIPNQPTGGLWFAGETITLAVAAAGQPTLGYRWCLNGTNLPADTNLTGSDTASLTISNFQSAYVGDYTVVVTNAYGGLTSQVAKVLMVLPPQITNHPGDKQGVVGTDISFQMRVTGTEPLSYQWRFADNDLTDGMHINGSKSDTLTITNIQGSDAGSFTLVISNILGSITSAPVNMTVLYAPIVSHMSPATTNVPVNSSASLAVAVAGQPPLMCQWYSNGIAVVDATNLNLILGATPCAADGQAYYFVVTNLYGSATSQVTILHVVDTNLPVLVGQLLLGTTNILAGSNCQWTVSTAANCNPVTLHWYRDGNVFRGSGDYLILTNVQPADAGAYSVVASNVNGTATGQVATLNVLVPPQITWHPTNQTVVVSNSCGFDVTATGSAPLSYQWQLNGENVSNNVTATSATLLLTNIQSAMAGQYQVVVTNIVGAVTSAPAILTVLVPPRILISPASRMVVVGDAVNLRVDAIGTMPLGYIWMANGTNLVDQLRISGTTSNTLSIADVQKSDAVGYVVVITNVVGSVTSTPLAMLEVHSSGFTQPQRETNGHFTLNLHGQTNTWFEIQATATMTNWSTIGFVTNYNGTFQFQDLTTNFTHRYYRAIERP